MKSHIASSSLNDNSISYSIKDQVDTTLKSIETYVIDSHKLLGMDGKIAILHNGEIYQLKQTRVGKLILIK